MPRYALFLNVLFKCVLAPESVIAIVTLLLSMVLFVIVQLLPPLIPPPLVSRFRSQASHELLVICIQFICPPNPNPELRMMQFFIVQS